MAEHGLSAAQRVRRRPDFERAYDTGVRIHGRLMTVFIAANERPGARLGVAATRKLGSAVQRNRAKRLVREAFRRNKLAKGIDIIIVPRRELLDASFTAIEADYRAVLDRRTRERPRARPRPPAGRRRRGPAPRV